MSIWKRNSNLALLSYCTNVHPGESPDEIMEALRRYTLPIKKRLAPEHPMAVGLWLGQKAIHALTTNRKSLEAFQGFIKGTGLLPYTMNAFPYGDFHSDRVKEGVFRPTWLDEERVVYTARAARILAGIIGEDETGSLSTHSGAFRGEGTGEKLKEGVLRNLLRVVESLHLLHQETARTILLCIEPEPFSTLESTAEVVDFFHDFVFSRGPRILADETEMDLRQAEEAIFTHLGVCFDTCHLSVQFENLRESARLYRTQGIRVGKVQISNALELPSPGENPDGVEALRRFQEERYLHQVVGQSSSGELLRAPDLDSLLSAPPEEMKRWMELDRWRVHFHVPLTWDQQAPLATTRKEAAEVLPLVLNEHICNHLEIETYTWDVLPEDDRDEDLVDSLEGEFRWVGAVLRSAGWLPV